ncbi:MAG: very short patch repair endonuclease [Luteolibacter sp.]
MSRIRGRDTRPELALRSMLHRLGYRFTVQGPKNKSLPGRPDLVLPKYRTVIFVHGCFWHGRKAASTSASRNPTAPSGRRRSKAIRPAISAPKTLSAAAAWCTGTIWERALETALAQQ